MAKGSKYYVVWKGKNPGVYDNWDLCKLQVDGFIGAQFKSFPNQAQAEDAFRNNFKDYVDFSKPKQKTVGPISSSKINRNTICVDAACSGNPGLMEYRGVDTQTGKELFHQGPYKEGTNNIGEFLALVHGIAFLTKNKIDKEIYSDSITAIAWVRAKKAKTKLEMTANNQELFDRISKAENYLKNNPTTIRIHKWETESWGEIPADFGRK